MAFGSGARLSWLLAMALVALGVEVCWCDAGGPLPPSFYSPSGDLNQVKFAHRSSLIPYKSHGKRRSLEVLRNDTFSLLVINDLTAFKRHYSAIPSPDGESIYVVWGFCRDIITKILIDCMRDGEEKIDNDAPGDYGYGYEGDGDELSRSEFNHGGSDTAQQQQQLFQTSVMSRFNQFATQVAGGLPGSECSPRVINGGVFKLSREGIERVGVGGGLEAIAGEGDGKWRGWRIGDGEGREGGWGLGISKDGRVLWGRMEDWGIEDDPAAEAVKKEIKL